MIETLYFYAALVGGTLLAAQFLLMLLGLADGDGSHGADFSGGSVGHAGGGLHGDSGLGHGHGASDHAPGADHQGGHWFYEKLSLRTISAAVTFFGLTGKAALARGMHPAPTLILSLLAGYGALVGVYWLFKQAYRLEQAGNENVRLAVGLPAVVYVPIPGRRGGAGKVTFRLQNRTVEYQAVTDDAERLATGEKVIVAAVVSADTVCVARAPELVAR